MNAVVAKAGQPIGAARLSDEQWVIARHPVDKHAVVLAVAGSGKSTTMVERMAYLIETHRVEPRRVIAVMFNRSAAEEMDERLTARLGKRNTPDSMTYHRLGTLVLKMLTPKYAPAWKFDASPVAATKFAIRAIAPFLTEYKYPRFAAEAFLGFVDRVKSDLADPYQVLEDGEWNAKQQWFPLAYDMYEKARHEEGLRFFSDLIYDPVMAIQNNPEAARFVAGRFDHIIVDEYQDICESQQALIKAVAGSHARVMVVGDDDQTIYTWRGANPAYILRDFEKDFVGATVYKLSKTWRYGHGLSCAANYLITNNKDRAPKLCISGSNARTRLRLVQGDPYSVIKVLRPMIKANFSLSQIAILVRAYSHSGQAQLEMLAHGIPFRLEGGEKVAVLENEWVKKLIGWLSVGVGDIAARPYAGEPDFGSIMRLKEVLSSRWTELTWDESTKFCSTILSKPNGSEGFSFYANHHVDGTRKKQRDGIRLMSIMWSSVKQMNGLKGVSPYELFNQITTHFDFDNKIGASYLREEDAETNVLLVKSFLSYAKQFKGDCVSFLSHVLSLKSFSDEAKKAVDAVHITSLHRSKGLEWDAVLMLGLVQGKFPLASRKKEDGLKTAVRLEDERRLFYVGMTRARKHIYFIAPLDNNVEADKEAAFDTSLDYQRPKEHGSLMLRLLAGNPKAPFSLLDTADDAEIALNKADKDDGVYPSQFLYESNILVSDDLHEFIAKTSKQANQVSPEYFNKYLEIIGARKRAAKIRG